MIKFFVEMQSFDISEGVFLCRVDNKYGVSSM